MVLWDLGFIYDILPPDTALTDTALTDALVEWYDPDRDIGYWAKKDLENEETN